MNIETLKQILALLHNLVACMGSAKDGGPGSGPHAGGGSATSYEAQKRADRQAGSANHAELARLAHKGYVNATSQGNGTMAKYYGERHLFHKAEMKRMAGTKDKTLGSFPSGYKF